MPRDARSRLPGAPAFRRMPPMRTLLLLAALAAAARAQDPGLEERLKAAGAKEESVETGEILADDPAEGDGYETRVVRLKAADVAPPFVLTDNGTKLFVADRSGVIRRIALPSWKEERRLWIGKPVTGIAKGKEGILAAVPDRKQLLLVKEDPLSVSYHWYFEEVAAVYAGPSSFFAWIPKFTAGRQTDLQVIEQESHALQPTLNGLAMMEEQKTQGAYKRNPGSRLMSTIENVTLAPKGDWVMATSSDCIFRMRPAGVKLMVEEASSPMGRLSHIAVSGDGTLVAVASPLPENMPEGWPAMKEAGTLVFKSKDLSKPVAAIEGIDAWGFTRTPDRVFGFREGGTFVVQTFKGKIERSVEIGHAGKPLDAKQAGDGLKFVLHLGEAIAWVWFK